MLFSSCHRVNGLTANEDTPSHPADRIGPYQRCKFLAEEAAGHGSVTQGNLSQSNRVETY